jgi:protein-disulfide isomerase
MARTSRIAVLLAWLIAAHATAQTSAPVAAAASAPADRVVATVRRTHEIRQSDLDAWRQRHAPAQLARLRQDVYESSRQAVEALVGEYLLAQAAAEHGVSVEAFVESQLDPALATGVRDEDVREIYEQSRSMMGNLTFDQAESAIRSYLDEKRRDDARRNVVGALLATAGADVAIDLEPPRYDVVPRGDEASLGPASAAVTLVAYSDFQCPFCKRAAPAVRKLVEDHPDAVRLVWRHFPLPGHPDARAAAEAAACAGEQDAFWEYHDQLFANQDALGLADLRRYAENVGVDVNQFDACVESHRYEAIVTEDLASGNRLGVAATPAVFINGRLILGAVGYDVYQRVIDEELRAGRVTGAGKP